MRYFLCLIFPLLFISSAFGQKMVSGFVVNTKGDTLQGTLFKPQQGENYHYVNFFEGGDKQRANQFSPDEIKGYSYEGVEFFKPFLLPGNTPIPYHQVFLKVLIDNGGATSLFLFKDEEKKEFFFIKEHGQNIVFLDRTTFENYLFDTFGADCQSEPFQNSIQKLKYSIPELSKVIFEYNRCKDSSYEMDMSYLSDGLYNLGITFTTGFNPFFTSRGTLDAPDALIAVSLESMNSEKSSLTAEFGLGIRTMSNKYVQIGNTSVSGDQYNSGEIESTTDLRLKFLYLSLKLKKTDSSDLYYFLGGGASYNFNVSKAYYSASSLRPEFTSRYSEEVLYAEREVNLNWFTPHVYVGLGKVFKSFMLESRLTYQNLNVGFNFSGTNEMGKVGNYYIRKEGASYYVVNPPQFPKFTIDLAITVPLRSF